MSWFHRSSPRRDEIRRARRETTPLKRFVRDRDAITSLAIAGAFLLVVSAIMMLRPEVVPYRPGQFVPHDIVSRVNFVYNNPDLYAAAQQSARDAEPRIYSQQEDVWKRIRDELIALPRRVANLTPEQLDPSLRSIIDGATLVKLQEIAAAQPQTAWDESVDGYIEAIRKLDLVILPADEREEDTGRMIRIPGRGPIRTENTLSLSPTARDDLAVKFTKPATDGFSNLLFPKVVQLTILWLGPTHTLDEGATVEARNTASNRISPETGNELKRANTTLVRRGEISQNEWRLLRAEHRAFRQQLTAGTWQEQVGAVGVVLLLTIALCGYIARYQPRIIRNHARAIGVAALLVAMLLLAQLAGIGSSQLYIFAIAPTILTAMILSIAYDQRFALGVASIHAGLVTFGLAQPIGFFVLLWFGTMVCCYLLDEVRTRDKLIRVGGGAAIALAAGTLAAGLLASDPWAYIGKNAMYAASAGLGSGFIVLGILPFIERAFRITTSMTLLELADGSHPLLRRLAIEAPGTWSHSLNVASLAEEAAEAIGANSLLCRVGAYYHDVGKINKADYFIENQQNQPSRHLNLSPSVSLLIIVGHVKDGVELAREYNLPTVLHSFITQHHGTTLVEFFYNAACNRVEQSQGLESAVSESQYRYPGPKPRSKETAILMLCDCVESACRAMSEPSASRIENVVHELAMRRLTDGQFDECDLTMRELELVERSLVKTLLGIYHGRIAYPSTQQQTGPSAIPIPSAAAPTLAPPAETRSA